MGALLVVLVATQDAAWGQTSAAWSNGAGGDYFTGTNWTGGVPASGATATADFNMLDLIGDPAVTLEAPLMIGNMIFGDTDLGSAGTWAITTANLGTAILTLDNGGSKPTITVNPLTPTAFDDTFIGNSVAGTMGFRKLGAGILTLGPGTANTITGGIDVEAGTLRLQAVVPAQVVTLADGTTLETAGNHNSGVTIPEGGTVTYRYTGVGAGSASNVMAPGTTATLNLNILNNTTLSAGGAWTGFANINATGQSGAGVSFFRIMPNPTGGPPFFNTDSFANTHLHLDNVQLVVRTNSFGNTIPIGELTGTAAGVLSGGNAGSAARYQLGDVDDTYTYAGQINGAGGVSINKVGTGTITLAGTWVGNPAINNTPARQGGVFRVTAGTLAITGQTSIPGGPPANPTILTTIDVLPGATFDVSGAPGTFTTSTQQKVQGGGRILGTYSHAAGFIRAGDVAAATAANEGNLSAGVVPTAGTLTFDGEFQFNGGTIIHDTSLDPNSGNDLVHVTGNVALNSGRIQPNFLNGVPSGGTYTVMSWDGSMSGAASNIIVDFPGRTPDEPAQLSGNSLVFSPSNVVPGADLVWTGSVNSNWDNAQVDQNWDNAGNPDVFFEFDSVTFPEAAANKTVTVGALVSPSAVTINNTSAYTFNGTGAIVGTGTFTKTGAGMLTMPLANTFSGASSIEGTVDVGAAGGALGTGTLTLNDATLISTASLSNSEVIVPDGSTSTIQGNGTADLGGALNVGAISGGGTLTLTSVVDNKAFGTNVTANFTGTLNIQPTAPATLLNAVRIRGGQTTFPDAVVNITGARISNQQGAAAGTTATVAFGELHGDATTSLVAFEGGSGPPNINWEIGNLGTDSNFDGVIADGAGAGLPSIASITKVGGGTLSLSALNTYTGDTTVQAGTLRTTNATVLPDATDLFLSTGGSVFLDFVGTDTINGLVFDGVAQGVATYGATGSGAAIIRDDFFSGTGVLSVAAAPVLYGDYNENGIVDAADYTTWRDHLGQTFALPNRHPSNTGAISQADYNVWKASFGVAIGAGAGSLTSQSSVPEPACMTLLALAGLIAVGRRRR